MAKETTKKVSETVDSAVSKATTKKTTTASKSAAKTETKPKTAAKTTAAKPETVKKETTKKTETTKKVKAEKPAESVAETKVEKEPVKQPEKNSTSNLFGDFAISKLGLGLIAGTMCVSIGLGVAGIAIAGGKVGDKGKSAYEIAVENGFSGSEEDWLASLKGNTGANGVQGIQGVPGVQGDSVYLDYAGNVWEGNTKTNVSFNIALEDSVYDNTLEISKTMSKHFVPTYVDLSSDTMALMNNYMENANVTLYSGTKITSLTLVSANTGTLHIGTAKVADIVNARVNGGTYEVNSVSKNLYAGTNTISLDLTVAEDETLVLGGKGSTARLFTTKNIPLNDENGNYTIVNGEQNVTVLAKTGNYNDTVAIKTEVDNVATESVFSTVTSVTCTSIVSDTAAPFVYNDKTLFAGKTITELGMYVMSLEKAVTQDQTMTVYIVDKTAASEYSKGTPITVTVPASEFTGTTQSNVKKWVYATNFKDALGNTLNGITLTENQTLAFGAQTGDSINWGYTTSLISDYAFTTNSGGNGNASLVFDIKTKTTKTKEKHLQELESKEAAAIQVKKETVLKQVLTGKNLSILGDSISTFPGWSNNAANTNSTIGGNAVYYSDGRCGIDDVNKTYWKKVANSTGMNVLVDNAWSGDKVTNRGLTRCEQLHDDTGNPDGGVINPDVIIVYLGINDFDGSVPVDTFTSTYSQMIQKITTKYSSADVFVCTLIPNKTRVADDVMRQYNQAIKNAASTYGATVVDFYNDSGITADNCTTYMGDGSAALHPNEAGMTLMANSIWRTLYNKYIASSSN